MKILYTKAALRTVEADLKQTILTGSITSTPVTVEEEKVKVNSFKEDKTFQDNGFADISF